MLIPFYHASKNRFDLVIPWGVSPKKVTSGSEEWLHCRGRPWGADAKGNQRFRERRIAISCHHLPSLKRT